MKIISTPDQLPLLGLSAEITDELEEQLITLPFGSVETANQFWQDSGTSLVLAEAEDSLDTLLRSYPHLHYLIQYPEFLSPLAEGWYLMLAISNDAGGGGYLVFPQGLDPTFDQLISPSSTDLGTPT